MDDLATTDDGELVLRLSAGDDAALAPLVARHWGEAWRVARPLAGDAAAEDAAQEAFLQLVQDDPPLFAKLAVGLAELVAHRFRSTVAQLEPVRAFAASLDQPMDLPADAAPAYDEIDEPLPEQAVEMLKRLAHAAADGSAGV